MNAAGQVLIEYLMLMVIFMLLLGAIIHKIPVTFQQSSPYLAGKIEQRLETGNGFSGGVWQPPQQPDGKGGAID